ncbi:exocyst complex, component exoc1 [Trichoderma arundinaceum]|uniref:Exocyst complex, component exoc1 n=1 Tax=Trichoderma arundinaceum TaxID=490622 RepID=A0A395N9B5_TRIAR|nr:exocyst complex, component exoc1 [Trichoderma arundinaceum]
MDHTNATGSNAAANRAERFEDEKRRIIDSCFNKKDTDGLLHETYITHIRVTEYSSHSSMPPPPEARGLNTEKPRIIVVAVRKSGRVRVHKSKENSSGSFSIGKTWNLDDLSHIESYTGPKVSPNLREWAGETGFLVTLGKPYFWQAQTEKEKKFFIASLIKIYSKYTGGKLPELSGFDQRELDQILGAGKRPTGTPPRQQMIDSAASQQSVTTSSAAPKNGPGDVSRYPRPNPIVRPSPNETMSPAGSFDSTASRERSVPRWTAQNNKSQESIANSTGTKGDDTSSLPPRSRSGMTGPSGLSALGEPRDTPDPTHDSLPAISRPLQESKLPPERRRPPMDPSRPQDRDLVPAPLMSSAAKREPVAPPPRSVGRGVPQTIPTVLQPGMAFASRGHDESPLHAAETLDDTERKSGNISVNSDTRDLPAASPADTSTPDQSATNDVSTPERIVSDPEEDTRPGLGPMIKSKKSKGDVAGAFWKAASAANAFRPRPGGAGERLRQIQAKANEGPDGITSVVPAPPRPVSRDTNLPTLEPPRPTAGDLTIPEVKILVAEPANTAGSQGPVNEVNEAEKDAVASKEASRRPVAIGQDARYLQKLGVDPNILDDRSEEFGKWLDFFGWVPGDQMHCLSMDDIGSDLERELNTVQAGGWLARFQEEDERVNTIKRGIDLAMGECEELDNLLTLYSVELSTLSDDIAYIEAQGQGLQVQTANQKLLRKELESLLETCAITSNDLQALQQAPLDSHRGLEEVELSLVTLFRAMIKIDPSLGGDDIGKSMDAVLDADHALGLNSNYGKMRIVQEKREMYLHESRYFMKRLLDFMSGQFGEAYVETKRALDGALSKKIDPAHHSVGRDLLWKYSPLMLYARDADLENWNRLMQIYQDKSSPVYKHEFQNVVAIWRKNARKLTGDEAELIFSSQVEKQQEGVATAARKLTVKRSQTLAKALRSPLADGGTRAHTERNSTDTRSLPYEIFSGVLEDLLPLVEMEQNFIIDFFHATTLEQADFPEAVAACPPRDRRGGDLKRHRLMEPDRELARRVTRSMEAIFAFLEAELRRLMEWAIAQDPLQGVGVLATLEKKLSEMGQSNQDFLNALLQKLHASLEGQFRKFVDEQIRAIEETKVKIKKRKGVISFIRIFPAFMTAVENMIAGLDQNLILRRTVNREYDRILKTMFESLMVIAREHPAVGVASGTADPEDKEALNFHILLIENMNHFLEETDARGLDVLENWKAQANTEYHEHMALYLNTVMRRPLGRLLEQVENIEAQLQTGKSAMAIARQPSNNKTAFNKVLGSYDSKEVRKGIETLRKRVEKHFGDADDPTLSRGLVIRVLKECEEFYTGVENRIGRIITDVYSGEVSFEWPRADVKAAFR